MSTKTIHLKRRFLNPKEGLAAIEGTVFVEVVDKWADVNAELHISDCARSIILDFNIHSGNVGDEVSLALRLKRAKLDTLRTQVNEFCDAVLESYNLLEKEITRIKDQSPDSRYPADPVVP